MTSPSGVNYRYCCVPMCKSTSISTPGKLFLYVPKDSIKRNLWFTAMRRKNPLSATTTAYCCSDHFNLENDMENYIQWSMMPNIIPKLKAGVLPNLFECQTTRTEKQPMKRPLNTLASKRISKVLIQEILNSNVPSAPGDSTCSGDTTAPGFSTAADPSPVQEPIIEVPMACEVVASDIPGTSGEVVCNYCTCNRKDLSHVMVQTEPILPQLEVTPISQTRLHVDDVFTESDTSQDVESLPTDPSSFKEPSSSDYVPCSSTATSSDTKVLICYNLTRKKILSNTMLFLGLPNNAAFILNTLAKHCRTTEKNIIFCLKKIRLNEPYTILAYDFDVSPEYLGLIFKNYVPKIAECLKNLIVWPEKSKVFLNLPIPFRARFSKVVAIIDCFEIEIQKPSNSIHQALSWSEYKKCNTLKYLIGCTPDGTCCFVSCGFGGRATDAIILRESGFLNKIEAGTEIMADRGFKHVEKDIIDKGARLVRPPSTIGGETLTKDDARLTKQIAALRIHVERVIGRIRHYHFLSPHVCLDNKLIKFADSVTVIVCAMTNLHSPIIQ